MDSRRAGDTGGGRAGEGILARRGAAAPHAARREPGDPEARGGGRQAGLRPVVPGRHADRCGAGPLRLRAADAQPPPRRPARGPGAEPARAGQGGDRRQRVHGGAPPPAGERLPGPPPDHQGGGEAEPGQRDSLRAAPARRRDRDPHLPSQPARPGRVPGGPRRPGAAGGPRAPAGPPERRLHPRAGNRVLPGSQRPVAVPRARPAELRATAHRPQHRHRAPHAGRHQAAGRAGPGGGPHAEACGPGRDSRAATWWRSRFARCASSGPSSRSTGRARTSPRRRAPSWPARGRAEVREGSCCDRAVPRRR